MSRDDRGMPSPGVPSRSTRAPCPCRGVPRRRAMRSALAVLSALLALSAPGARAGDGDGENQVKADMLWNIAKFIRWPDSSFGPGQREFVFTILGQDSLAEVLAANLSTRSLSGRPVFVRVVGRAQDAAGSQILYVASSAIDRVPEVLRALHGAPVLTVANTPGFVTGGGMVGFVAEDAKVRFEIHQGRAEQAGLKISARLLALAHVVDNDAAATR
jgi:hypothetical protein